jgi:hypothetical protein
MTVWFVIVSLLVVTLTPTVYYSTNEEYIREGCLAPEEEETKGPGR